MEIAGTGFLTNYSYDTANQITTITQGAQTRTVQLDPGGRVTKTTEPERGTTTYSYNYNSTGLVVTRTRPQANQSNPNVLTTTATQYDSLGRISSVSYNDGLTPYKSFLYDTASGWPNASSATNLKGQLAQMGAETSSADLTQALFSYDLMGNATTMWQCAPSSCGTSSMWNKPPITMSYDLAGNLIAEADGASGNITYGRSPAGEVTSITNLSYTDMYNTPNLVSNVQNGPNGPVSYTLGNGLNVYKGYDSVGRVYASWLCNGPAQFNCTTQIYGTDAYRRGARVTSMDDTVLQAATSYYYDEFNRLTQTNRSYWNNATDIFTYGYDRYGNRWSQNVTQGSGPAPSVAFDSATNRITTGGYGYDAAGNLTNDGLHAYTYDAEGNLIKVDGGSTAQYTYDALNRRVRAQTSASTYEYLHDSAGRRISSWLQPSNFGFEGRIYWDGQQIAYRAWNGTTFYDHQDILGTERMRTNYTGAIASTHTSLPWGDGYGSTGNDPYGNDLDNLHFATLDADSESGTEHAQFRQYSSTQGRWMTPDPYDGSYDLSDPQSFNRYGYVLNNPLGFVDPIGLSDCTAWELAHGMCVVQIVVNVSTPPPPNVPTITGPGENGPGSNPRSGGSTPNNPAPAPNNAKQTQQQCLNNYYNSKAGKTVAFGSVLSMAPGWGPDPGKATLENIFLTGGKLLGLKGLSKVAGNASVPSVTGGASTSIASPLEGIISSASSKILNFVGVAGPITIGSATLTDLSAHYACWAAANPGLADSWSQNQQY
jgi:RHS repeat-associated protein